MGEGTVLASRTGTVRGQVPAHARLVPRVNDRRVVHRLARSSRAVQAGIININNEAL